MVDYLEPLEEVGLLCFLLLLLYSPYTDVYMALARPVSHLTEKTIHMEVRSWIMQCMLLQYRGSLRM